jgi:transcriptional regulator with XRE-family HTH domain
MSFGKTLQKIRRSKDMTQRDVANIIPMDYSYYSKLENDRFDSNPTRETIEKIAKALNCSDEEKNDLFASAGRATEEIEQASFIASKNPEMRKPLGKLFKAAINLSPERLDKLAEEVEAETQKIRSENKGVKK